MRESLTEIIYQKDCAYLYKNLKPKSSMPLLSDADSLVKKLKCPHFDVTFGWMLLKQLYLPC